MARISFFAFLPRAWALALLILTVGSPRLAQAAAAAQVVISGQDVNGHAVAVNGSGDVFIADTSDNRIVVARTESTTRRCTE